MKKEKNSKEQMNERTNERTVSWAVRHGTARHGTAHD